MSILIHSIQILIHILYYELTMSIHNIKFVRLNRIQIFYLDKERKKESRKYSYIVNSAYMTKDFFIFYITKMSPL